MIIKRINSLSRQIRFDRSTFILILSNLVTALFAVLEEWDVSQVIFIYWGQSIIIGISNVKRILDLKGFTTKGFKINNKPVEPTRKTQIQTAVFFAVHFGFFHLVYMIFLIIDGAPIASESALFFFLCLGAFALNHLFSYQHNKKKEMHRKPNIGTIMFLPYARILPMHSIILFGGFLGGGSTAILIFFLGLKTIADIVMHIWEHAKLR